MSERCLFLYQPLASAGAMLLAKRKKNIIFNANNKIMNFLILLFSPLKAIDRARRRWTEMSKQATSNKPHFIVHLTGLLLGVPASPRGKLSHSSVKHREVF